MNFIHFKHKETGGEFDAPDEDGVREFYEARGWKETDRPEPAPFMATPNDIDPDSVPQDWVVLYHPETRATHDFPNNPEAIAGAQESGWEFPPKARTQDDMPPAPEPDSKPPKAKAPAKAAETEEK